MRPTLLSSILVLCGGCGLSPLSNRIEVGIDPFLVFVGEGIDHNTDLFVAEPGGGRVLQITFSSVIEASPQVTPDGSVVAFLRMRDTLPATPRDIVLMSLANGSEYRLPLPPDAGTARAVAWSDDLRAVYVLTTQGIWKLAVPPDTAAAMPLAGAELFAADSALTPWAGKPRFARIATCPAGGVCLIPPGGDTITVTAAGRHAFAWGSDSLAWFEGADVVVRSLGAGTPRRIDWTSPPANARDASYTGAIRKQPENQE